MRYQFSALFHRAWVRSMTMVNVISAFHSTGVFPLNRKALAPAAPPPFENVSQKVNFKKNEPRLPKKVLMSLHEAMMP